MGLMSDAVHEQVDTMRTLMLQVARGESSVEYMGRWLYTHYPDQSPGLPPNMQQSLSGWNPSGPEGDFKPYVRPKNQCDQ